MDTSNNKTVDADDIRSTSIFIFPFQYHLGISNSDTLPDRASQLLSGGNTDKNKGWAEESFMVSSSEQYNEWNYFHPPVRDVLFSREEMDCMRYLTREDYKILEVKYYSEEVKDPQNLPSTKTLTAAIKSIDLHLFDNGIGLLSFTTELKEPYDFNHLLRYNDIVRRIFPPYLGKDNTQFGGVSAPKMTGLVLPASIAIYGEQDNDSTVIKENFEEIKLSNFIPELLKPLQYLNEENFNDGNNAFHPFTDDRMFLISFYRDNVLAEQLSVLRPDGYCYEQDDRWYKFLFVDGSSQGIANKEMQRDLIKRCTYRRWARYGTLYGFSRYSFVAIADREKFSKLTAVHVKTIYYQMALSMLFQRLMLIRMSHEIRNVMHRQKDKDKKHVVEIEELQKKFVVYSTKYGFHEISPQEQGIEMYRQWRKIIDYDDLFEKVNNEIQRAAEFVQTQEASKTNRAIKRMTLFLVILALIPIVGVENIYRFIKGNSALQWGLIFLLLITGFTVMIWSSRGWIRKTLTKFISRRSDREGMPENISPNATSIICPRNDGESVAIMGIALRYDFDVRISKQDWGATLANEPYESFRALKEHVIIVEIPGTLAENDLRNRHRVYPLDHHQYPGLDRRNEKSSLEQFAALIHYSLDRKETGVAINDRAAIKGLVDAGYTREEIETIRQFDQQAQGYTDEDRRILREDYNNGEVQNGKFFLVKTHSKKTGYLYDLFYWEKPRNCPAEILAVFSLDEQSMVTEIMVYGPARIVKEIVKRNRGFSGGDERLGMYGGILLPNPLKEDSAMKILETV